MVTLDKPSASHADWTMEINVHSTTIENRAPNGVCVVVTYFKGNE